MSLKDLTLYAGHDVPNNWSGSYKNNCDVKYVKYFNNAVCSLKE